MKRALIALAAFAMTSLALTGLASAEQTYCQQKGHGAYGCELLGGTKGYCKKNTNSGTGYVCSEDDPNKEAAATARGKESLQLAPR